MNEILEVAGTVFARQGFHSTSMDEIAEGAGVTKPLLYRYFGSKDALYLATIDQVGQHLMVGLNLCMQEQDPIRRLEQSTFAFMGFVNKYKEGWSVLFNETLSTIGPVGERVAYYRQAFIDAATNSMLAIMGQAEPSAAGIIRAQAMATSLIGAVESLCRWWVNHPNLALPDIHNMLHELWMPGLKALGQNTQG